jgi:hypothetical protein
MRTTSHNKRNGATTTAGIATPKNAAMLPSTPGCDLKNQTKRQITTKSTRATFQALTIFSSSSAHRVPSEEDASSANRTLRLLSSRRLSSASQRLSDDHADPAGDYKFNPLILDEVQSGADNGTRLDRAAQQ